MAEVSRDPRGSAFAFHHPVLETVSLSWSELARRTWREIVADDVLGLAAQLSYYFFLALFPAILFLLALASFFPLSNITDDVSRSLGPFVSPQVLDLIQDRLADILEIEASSINEGDSFADDLDADSLALIELVEALEEELGERTVGFRIDDEDLEDLKTVRDAVDYVVAKLEA